MGFGTKDRRYVTAKWNEPDGHCCSDMETDSGGSEHYPTRPALPPVPCRLPLIPCGIRRMTLQHRYLRQLRGGERERNVKHNKEGKIRLIIAASTPRVVAH